MIRTIFLLPLAFGSALILTAGGVTRAETLKESLQTALSSHPGVEAAIAIQEEAVQEEKEKSAGLYPEANLNAAGGRIFGDNSTSRGLSVSRGQAYSWLWEGSASLTQPLFDGRETFRRIDAAEARKGSAQFTVADAQESLALRAVQAYLNVLRGREAMEKAESYREKAADYRARITAMVDDGVADESEAAQAENLTLMLEGMLADIEGQVSAALADYAEAVGKLPDSELQKPVIPPLPDFADGAAAAAHAIVHHPAVLASTQTSEAAKFDAEAERGTLFPDLDGELSYLKRDQVEEIGGEVEDARALLRANWTLSTGGAEMARIRRAKAAHSESLARTREAQRQIERDVRLAYSNLEAAQKQQNVAWQRKVVTDNLFAAYETQFEGARVRLLQLMQADSQRFNADIDALNAEYRTMMAQFGILASLGQLKNAVLEGAGE